MSSLPHVLMRITCRRMSTKTQDTHAVWKELNRLASEGKWDDVNCMPKLFLFGSAKREAYALFNAINYKTDIWSSSPYGQFARLFFRIAVMIATIQAGVMLYEFLVPEEKRLKYKYRDKHEDGHGHH